MSAADRLDEAADLYAVRDGSSATVSQLRRLAHQLRVAPALLDPTTPGRAEQLGPAGTRWVEQLAATDTCDPLERIRDELPGGVHALLEVDGLGPKRVHTAWALGLRDPAALASALRHGPVVGLPSPEVLLPALEQWARQRRELPWRTAATLANTAMERLRAHPAVQEVVSAGAVRRGDRAVSTIELVVATTEPSLALTVDDQPVPVTLHRCAPDRLVPTLLWHTATRLHRMSLGAHARRRGLRWTEEGLFKADGAPVPLPTEQAFFAALGLPTIAPSQRLGTGELQLALADALPAPLRADQLRGDLHTHTTWSDGKHSIEAMARAAKAAGLDYLAVTDHTQSTAIAGGLDPDQVAEQHRAWPHVEGLTLLRGTECDILPDGTLDLPSPVLASLDWVVASIHSRLDLPSNLQTERLLAAIRSGLVDAIGHPTGARVGRREGVSFEWKRVFAACVEWDVALEINGNPGRMDLDGRLARSAWAHGVRLVINTDAHAADQLGQWDAALQVAHRAALPAQAVVNTEPWHTIAARRRARLARVHNGAMPSDHDTA